MKNIKYLLILYFYFISNGLLAQEVVILNLAELHKEGKLITKNRSVTVENEQGKSFIRVGGGVGGGAIWLPIDNFKSGKIEMVARGKDIAQGSFYGISFHCLNDSTYDDVYCRPFNYKTTDSLRKIHAVQYVSYPDFDWQRLRKEFNGQYEKGIANPPNADDWVTLTLEIEGENVKAYINHAAQPSLVVKKLNKRTNGKVGISGFNCDIEQIRVIQSD